MSLTLPVGGTPMDYQRVPAGSHVALCDLVADCGLQPGSAQYPEPRRKLYVRFEIPAERIQYKKDGATAEGPLTIGAWYTASMNVKATLRRHLEGWRGRAFTDQEAAAFDVSAILGKACMLTVVEVDRGGQTYSNITSIGKLPKGVRPPLAENPLLYYDETAGAQALAALPPWLAKKIAAQIAPDPDPLMDEPGDADAPVQDDEVPF